MDRKTHHLRRRRLIKPRLQLRMILHFAVVSAIALVVQLLMFDALWTSFAASSAPSVGDAVIQQLPAVSLKSLAVSFLVSLPLTVAVGVLMTFRLAGPIYRFEQYLDQVLRDEDEGPCRLRRGDELQGLCRQLNEVVGALRERGKTEQEEPGSARAA